MTINFPLSLAEFWDATKIMSGTEIEILPYQRQSEDGEGNVFAAIKGFPKWYGTFELVPNNFAMVGQVEAFFKALQIRHGSFLAYDKRKPYPTYDTDGALLGGSNVLIRSKGANNRSISLKQLPNRYVITKGDWISVAYQSTKVFLCQAMETVIADFSGQTTEFEIVPFLPPGLAVNDPVTLKKPCGKFRLVSDSYQPAHAQGVISGGISFSMLSVP